MQLSDSPIARRRNGLLAKVVLCIAAVCSGGCLSKELSTRADAVVTWVRQDERALRGYLPPDIEDVYYSSFTGHNIAIFQSVWKVGDIPDAPVPTHFSIGIGQTRKIGKLAKIAIAKIASNDQGELACAYVFLQWNPGKQQYEYTQADGEAFLLPPDANPPTSHRPPATQPARDD